MYGIYSQGTANTLINNNVIAGLTNRYHGSHYASISTGIFCNRGTNTISNNLVSNIRTFTGNESGYSSASVIGIAITTSSLSGLVQSITGNEISLLANLHPSARVDLYGIYMNGAADTWHEVSGNYLHQFSLATSNNGSFVDALVLYTGKVNCFNNIVQLTNDYYGNNNGGTYNMNGVWHHASSNGDINFHHNTVVLDGTVNPASSTSSSHAFWNNGNLTIKNITNNLFVNKRNGGLGGRHYAIRMAGNNNVTINYNVYNSAAGQPLGRYGTTDRNTLTDWKASTGQDASSTDLDPGFNTIWTAVAQQFIPTSGLQGQFLAGFPLDFDGTPRTQTPTIGAFEQLFVWSGLLNSDWGTPDNWVSQQVPEEGKSVYVPASAAHFPMLDQGRGTGRLVIEAGASLTIPPLTHLTVHGELQNNGGANGLFIFEDSNGSGSLIHATPNVEATVECQLPGAAKAWHMIASPLTNMSIAGSAFEPGASDDFYLWHEPSPGTWVNYKNQDGSGGNPTFPEANQNGNLFIPGMGYLCAYNEANPTKQFSGTMHAGEIVIPLQFSGAKSWTWEAGWNLIGNPYPSSIDWDLIDKSSLAEIHAQVYDPAFGTGGGYRIVTSIAPKQGFFVKASDPNGSVVMNTSVQTHGASFYKTNNQLFTNKLTLKLFQQPFFDEASILIADGAAMCYDELDASKLFSHHPEMPQLFSRSADDRWLSVNTLPEIPQKTTVPLSYSAATQGPATLSINEITGQLTLAQIYLHDQLLDTIVNLSQTLSYPFIASSGVHHDRFLLSFLIPEPGADAALNVYAFKNLLVVQSWSVRTSIEVYAPNGKQVLSLTVGPGTHHIPTSLAQGVYLVNLFGTDAVLTKKLLLTGD